MTERAEKPSGGVSPDPYLCSEDLEARYDEWRVCESDVLLEDITQPKAECSYAHYDPEADAPSGFLLPINTDSFVAAEASPPFLQAATMPEPQSRFDSLMEPVTHYTDRISGEWNRLTGPTIASVSSAWRYLNVGDGRYVEPGSLVDDSIFSNAVKFRIVHKRFLGVGQLQHLEKVYSYGYARFGLFLGDYSTYAGFGGRVFFPSRPGVMVDTLEFGPSLRTPVASASYRMRFQEGHLQRRFYRRFGLTTERTFTDTIKGQNVRIRSSTFVNPSPALGIPGTGVDIRLLEEPLLSARAAYSQAKSQLLGNRTGLEKLAYRFSPEYKAQLGKTMNGLVSDLKNVHEGVWSHPVKDEKLAMLVAKKYTPMSSCIARAAANETGRGFMAWHWFLEGIREYHADVFDEKDPEVAAMRAGEIITDDLAALFTGYTAGYTAVGVTQGLNKLPLPGGRIGAGVGGGVASLFFATIGYNRTRELLHMAGVPRYMKELMLSTDDPEVVMQGVYVLMNAISSALAVNEVRYLVRIGTKAVKILKRAIDNIRKGPPGPPNPPLIGGDPKKSLPPEEFYIDDYMVPHPTPVLEPMAQASGQSLLSKAYEAEGFWGATGLVLTTILGAVMMRFCPSLMFQGSTAGGVMMMGPTQGGGIYTGDQSGFGPMA